MNSAELERRLDARPLLLDGAMGSMLMNRGLPAGRAPEWWTIEEPGVVRSIHAQYVDAGADLVLTCTFGGNRAKLRAVGLEARCREINERAVELAHAAAGGRALVGGDLGPTGILMPPLGTGTVEEVQEVYREQATHLAAAGADVLVLETVFDLREAIAAVQACRSSGLGTIAFMTFEKRPRGFFTIMGNPLVASLEALKEAGAGGVGANCSVGSGTMLQMIRELTNVEGIRVLAQPNAGAPRPGAGVAEYDANPEGFAADVVAMLQAGLRGVGGCCGTTPDFIRSLREAMSRDERRKA